MNGRWCTIARQTFQILSDLQLPVQSVPITTKVVSSNPVHDEVYPMLYVIKFVSDLRQPRGEPMCSAMYYH
jgi:hypothetical protein